MGADSRLTIASGGSPLEKKRKYRDSGDRSWKKRRISSRSAGPAAVTVATEPSRRISGLPGGASNGAGGGAAIRMGPSRVRNARERVRYDELVLGMMHGQHRAWRRPDDAFGDAAHQQVRHGLPAVRAHDDEIDARVRRVRDDRFGRRVRRAQHLPRAGS